MPTAKSAKNDHTLVKTIIANHVCIIQVATIYSAIFDMVIIYTLQVCRKFIIFLLCSQEENYFFHPCLSEVHCSQGEINNNSNSNHHLSGVHHQFYHKTNRCTPREGNENLGTLPPNFGSRDGISSVACQTSRTTGALPPSHLESSRTF